MINRGEWRTAGPKLFISMVTITAMTVLSAVCVAGSARAATATGGYGPLPPTAGTAALGGYSAVITSQTIAPAGGAIGPVNSAGVSVTLTIPAHAFPVPVQITLTAPGHTLAGDAGRAGDQAVAGVGIQVQKDGSAYSGTFRKPLTLTMRSSPITSSSVMVVWNGRAFVADTQATIKSSAAVVNFDTDPDFAVLTPAVAGTAIFGATTSPTGKPFIGEGVLAGVLVLLGASGLAIRWRRRERA